MLKYTTIIEKDKKRIFINLNDDKISENTKSKVSSFNKDAYESIFSIIQKEGLTSIEFVGEDVFDFSNREEIINFCKALHDNENIIETQIWANTRYKYKDLKNMKSNSVEDLFDQLDFIMESDGTTIDLGATAIQELFGNTDPVIIK